MEEIVRQGYASIASAYHERRLAKEAINVEWLDGLAHFFPPSGRVVDLGCGSGVPISRYFADRGYEVTGYDLSEAMLEIARREVPGGAFHCATLESLSLEPSSVDMVVSFFAIIHVDRELHARLFGRFVEWLRPGGVVLLSLGADDEPSRRSDEWHGVPMVWSHFDATRNLALLGESGLEVLWSDVEDHGDARHLFVIARNVG